MSGRLSLLRLAPLGLAWPWQPGRLPSHQASLPHPRPDGAAKLLGLGDAIARLDGFQGVGEVLVYPEGHTAQGHTLIIQQMPYRARLDLATDGPGTEAQAPLRLSLDADEVGVGAICPGTASAKRAVRAPMIARSPV